MAISGNISTSQGDSFLIRADVPIVGLLSLSAFTDTTTGSFDKEFRYSTDGINFVSWRELTNANLLAVSVNSADNFLIEYRYTNLLDSSASFTDINVSGSFEELACGEYYQKSIFKDYFDCRDNEVLQWCVNVTSKLYKKGIIPEYILRGNESNANSIDKDYVDFWRSLSCFFAYIVVFARKFKDFKGTESLLQEYINNIGLIYCPTQSLSQKNYLL